MSKSRDTTGGTDLHTATKERESEQRDQSSTDAATDENEQFTLSRDHEENWAMVMVLSLAGLGFLLASPLLLATATIPLLYAGAAALTGSPATAVSLTREFSGGGAENGTLSGEPGTSVTVRLHVHNESERHLVDLRLVDGVPDALPVIAGTPRASLTLDPGEHQTVAYTVELQRGEHTFGSTSLRTRDISGTTSVDWQGIPQGDQNVQCSPAVTHAPTAAASNEYAGDVPTDEGGNGIEFHSVREYEPGDPMRSIDWRRYASARELASIEYRAERSAQILCVVDARKTQFRSPAGSELSIAELTANAADRTVRLLLDDGHPTGVAAMQEGSIDIVSPGTGTEQRVRISKALATATNGAVSHDGISIRDSETAVSRRLHERPELALEQTTSNTTQVILFSGFVDDKPLDVLTHLRSLGYSVVAISPSVASAATADTERVSARLGELDQQNRLAKARAAGGRVLEWDLDDSVGTVLARAIREVHSQ